MKRLFLQRCSATLTVLLIVTVSVLAAGPPSFDLTWHSIDGGGGDCTDGTFELTGSIGQPDTGELNGGGFILTGGFLAFDAPTSPCPTDVDGDGAVNVPDLLALLNNWGPCVSCPEDFNGDGDVNVPDLLQLLSGWGLCP